MKKSVKIFLILLFLLLIIGVGIVVYLKISKPTQEEIPPVNEVKVTNTIDKYGYTLEDRDKELFIEKFEELKTLLNEENYDKETYIKLISELFIIDLYTISNKISRYDIGGLEYVYQDARESFKTVAENTIYKTVENNLDDSRNQKLPTVSSTKITEISETTYNMPDETTVDGYKVNISWEYEEDYGYDSSAVLILIQENEKWGVVFYKPKNWVLRKK